MKKAQGFTLVELIIVIVILGILAVTAAPKFIDFTSDAQVSAVKGVRGGMASAMQVINAKAAIDGKTTAADQDVNGVTTDYGYPEASADGIIAAIELDASDSHDTAADYAFSTSAAASDSSYGAGIVVGPWSKKKAKDSSASIVEADVTDSGCYIRYEAPASGTAAKVSSVTSGC